MLTFKNQEMELDSAPSYSRRIVRELSSLKPPASSLENSNRHTYEKLELPVSHRKHSVALISNRQENALHPRCFAAPQPSKLGPQAGVSLS